MKDEFDEFDKYDTGHKSRLPFKKRWIFLGFLLAIIIGIIIFIIWFFPKKDHISTKDVSSSYLIDNKDNFYDIQSRNDCSGFATSYVLRHLGIDAHGAKLYDSLHKTFGEYPAPNDIIKKVKEYGLTAKSFYGNLDTLKAELNKGVPVIALMYVNQRYKGKFEGLHYVAVVGYDEEYIYMADSCGVNMNIFGINSYNRKLTYNEFEELWDTKSDIFVRNAYIVISKK